MRPSLFTFQNYDYAGTPLTAAGYESLVRSTYGANADAVLAEYPSSSPRRTPRTSSCRST